jgi:hypothetical protein
MDVDEEKAEVERKEKVSPRASTAERSGLTTTRRQKAGTSLGYLIQSFWP